MIENENKGPVLHCQVVGAELFPQWNIMEFKVAKMILGIKNRVKPVKNSVSLSSGMQLRGASIIDPGSVKLVGNVKRKLVVFGFKIKISTQNFNNF